MLADVVTGIVANPRLGPPRTCPTVPTSCCGLLRQLGELHVNNVISVGIVACDDAIDMLVWCQVVKGCW